MNDQTNSATNGQQRKASDMFKHLILNLEDVNQMADSNFLVPNMIVQGHITLFAAPANGGKSTLFIYLCEQLSANGMDVIYINADSSPGDLKEHHSHATRHGYLVISPDTKVNRSIQDVQDMFNKIANSPDQCVNLVLVLDTLKKFVDMLDKKQLKTFFATLRAMTIKGATICLLGHTNKYLGKDGNSIFEGMGDVRTDIDDLIYLDSSINPDTGYLEVTTRPDKVRATFYPRSFIIELPSRAVRESTSVISIHSDEEAKLLQLVLNSIQKGCISQQDILNEVKSKTTMGINAIRSALVKFVRASDARITITLGQSGKGYIYSVK
jgi:hypothetical protein